MLELLVVAMLMASLLVNVLLAVLLYLKGKEKQQPQVKVKAEDELQKLGPLANCCKLLLEVTKRCEVRFTVIHRSLALPW